LFTGQVRLLVIPRTKGFSNLRGISMFDMLIKVGSELE